MENSGDKFASLLIPNCQRTASQEEKLQSCPFARESKVIPDDIQSSSSTEEAPEEVTGIEMVSLPDSFDEYQTPPEQPSYSQNSSNDGHVTIVDLANESGNLDTEKIDIDDPVDEIDAAKSVIEALETEVISSPEEDAHQVFVEMPQREKETSNRRKRKLLLLMKTQRQNNSYSKHEGFKVPVNRVLKMARSTGYGGGGGGDDVDIDFLETATKRGLRESLAFVASIDCLQMAHGDGWFIRESLDEVDVLPLYVGFPNLFSIRLHHGGCLTNGYGHAYVSGKINFMDLIDIDRFSVHEIGEMMISLGQEFGSKEEGKRLIRAHAVETRREIKIVKDDLQRVRAVCHGSLPDFEVDDHGVHFASQPKGAVVDKGKGKGAVVDKGKGKRAVVDKGKGAIVDKGKGKGTVVDKDKDSESWMVKTLITEHTCLQTRNPKSCTSSFIAEQLVEQVAENPEIPVTVVQDQFARKYEVGVSRMQAYRARAKAKKVVEGDYTKQYAMLKDYALKLKDKNPGTTVKFEVYPQPNPSENTRKFKRIYVCLGPLKEGFKALGRDLQGLDGAFMKGPYPGQILSAIGVDCNNGIYPVCYAIVESENLSSWTWFLELLGDDLDLCKQSKFTFISDRQKGLIPAITKGSFRGKLYKYMLWKCATATTIPKYRSAMEELKAFNNKAHSWLCKISPLHCSRSHFSGRALSDVLLNNMCEVYNGKIVQGRDKPIISALECIREYLMRRIVTVQKVIEKSEGLLTPNAAKMLEAIKKDAEHYHVQWNGEDRYSVTGRPSEPRVVDLGKRTCACRRWEITCMPCRHVVATIWFKATNGQRVGALESWVNLVYTMERPKKERKRSALEMDEMTKGGRLSKKNSKGTCEKCGIKGHNVRTCAVV
ncbi:hypothetical protein L1987_79648 [Smallanthus sonchifolius]|uniref:Uncharacterized protein n=1 Tax=Smallanthus sonchifolius TaxID=185202 RepID=A0ACB8YJQ0_9ASTR|nr:hypothetical protein L1987_79648 [Smallanthus sonchifolius]